MADKIFTADEQKVFEAQARRRGFKTLREYLQALLKQDAEQSNEAGDQLDDPVESFRQGWAQAMRGEGITFEELKQSLEKND